MQDIILYTKALFVQKKYRQCIHTCETFIAESDRDDHLLYMHFYLGMAHDDLARQMYDLSRFKSARFALAERHYEEALKLIAEIQREHCMLSPQRLPREASSMSLLSISTSSNTLVADEELTKHARAMREQILTHLAMVQRAKAQAEKAQRKRALDTPATPTLSSSKSYWSFTPEVVKTSEKQSRIAEGRARAWKRERFQPGRYEMLAELALSEL